MTTTSTPPSTPTSTPSSTSTPRPKRGGTHPIYGIYAGEAPLNDIYELITTNSFHHVLQVQSTKQANTNETTLITNMEDASKPKFNGNPDLTPCSLTKYDKEGFIWALKEKIKLCCLHTFFYLPNASGTMTYLFDHPHDFTLDIVTAEHNDHINTPPVIYKKDSLQNDTTTETTISIKARFHA